MANFYDHTFSPWKCPNGARVVASESMWREPLKWNKKAKEAGERHRVFCASLADVFEDWDGPMVMASGENVIRSSNGEPLGKEVNGMLFPEYATMDDIRRKLFTLIDATPNLDWLLVTKRPENVRRMWKAVCYVETVADTNYTRDKLVTVQFPFRKNIWLLTSVSDQATADAMIPHLLQCRDLVPVLGLSCEPLLGPVDLSEWVERIDHCASCDEESSPHEDDVCPHCGAENNTISTFGFAQAERYRTGERYDPKSEAGKRDIAGENNGIDWVICGGESGHGARPYDLAWPRSIIGQCKAAGVPVFHKQVGSLPMAPSVYRDGNTVLVLKDPKGGDMSEWPEDLRVREYPKAMEADNDPH